MSRELAPGLSQEETTSRKFPVSGGWRVVYGLFVVILPSFSFWAVQLIKPEWQSGDLQAYLALLLSAEASLIFLLLLAFSIFCYLLLMIDPNHFAESFLIRFGISAGAVLAFQYSIILFIYLFDNRYAYAIFLLWVLPLIFPRFYRWAIRRWSAYLVGWLFAILILTGVVIGFTVAREFLFFIIVGFLIAGPFWSLLIALQAALWLFQKSDGPHNLPRGLGVGAWLASYAVAWRYDILKMYEMYAQLPLVPPDCYIATAAARGHPALVGSRTVQLADGSSMCVNRQLQIFKCAELAFIVVSPKGHASVRKLYDVIGRRLAQSIQRPVMADIAYLALKPFEWLAGMILRRFIPDIDAMSIYN